LRTVDESVAVKRVDFRAGDHDDIGNPKDKPESQKTEDNQEHKPGKNTI
jgi:hypothetical protein